MDVSPGAWAVIGSLVAGVVGVLFGRNNLRRDTSAAKLAEAQDTQQIAAIQRYDVEIARMERRNERYSAQIEELLTELRLLREADAARQLAESRAAVEKMQKQVDKALHEVAPDKLAALVMESGFFDLDKPLRAAPPRPHVKPNDVFQAANPYGPASGSRKPTKPR